MTLFEMLTYIGVVWAISALMVSFKRASTTITPYRIEDHK